MRNREKLRANGVHKEKILTYSRRGKSIVNGGGVNIAPQVLNSGPSYRRYRNNNVQL